ncbi:MAG: ribokinase [Cyanobacteria bacterium REEB459]|nr:ribokinase [Cyanobacteria bacterium REEB459]
MALIYVLGSLNMDLVCHSSHLPQSGETVLGSQFEIQPGGKGANQAVAVARLAGASHLVGRVGQDSFGDRLIASARAARVNCAGISQDHRSPTGVAAIVVDRQGQNQIVVVPGANGQVGESELQVLDQHLHPGDFLLLQLEIPQPVVMAAAALAQQRGVRVILDPAPVQAPLTDGLYCHVYLITPNQIEASQLVGWPVQDQTTALRAAQTLRQQGVDIALVTLGAAGVVVASQEGCFHQPALTVAAVDTVAAGDAFNGGLAVALAEGRPLGEAVGFATAVAAYTVTQPGAQAAMPERSQLEGWLAGQRLPASQNLAPA